MTCYRVVSGCVLLLTAGAVGCAPSTFVRGEAGRKAIELREGIDPDRAWQEVVDVIAADWDVEQLSKDGGYIRTGWHYGISGGSRQTYRGRITIKFRPPNERQLEMKTEAHWWNPAGYWVRGYDTLVQRDAYGAIAGRVGRTIPR